MNALISFVQSIIITIVTVINPLLLPTDLRNKTKPEPTSQVIATKARTELVSCEIPKECSATGHKLLKRWECEVAVCCETNGKWEFYYDGRKCETPKDNSVTQTTPYQPAPTGDCTGPDGKHLNMSLEECKKFNSAWGKETLWFSGEAATDCLLFDGHHILADSQTCQDFNSRRYNPEANSAKKTPTTQVETQIDCATKYGVFKMSPSNCSWELAQEAKYSSSNTTYTAPPLPNSAPYKSSLNLPDTSDLNNNWPTLGPSIPQYPLECFYASGKTICR